MTTASPTVLNAPAVTTETQKPGDINLYFGRAASRHFTPVFLRLGISANQATAVWGLASLLNSYVIYMVLKGRFEFVPLVFLLYYLALVVDCVDGEVARALKTASPIGGKLLDGVWHKITECSLVAAYAAGITQTRWDLWALPLGLALMAGEAMHTYVYERRLLIIRVHAKSTESISGRTSVDTYRLGQGWRDFSWVQRRKALAALVQYKSVYFMIALALVSVDALFAGVVLLAAYKHFDWIRMITRTVNRPPQLASE
jgi:phosphatidylglycerophosphate synthase